MGKGGGNTNCRAQASMDAGAAAGASPLDTFEDLAARGPVEVHEDQTMLQLGGQGLTLGQLEAAVNRSLSQLGYYNSAPRHPSQLPTEEQRQAALNLILRDDGAIEEEKFGSLLEAYVRDQTSTVEGPLSHEGMDHLSQLYVEGAPRPEHVTVCWSNRGHQPVRHIYRADNRMLCGKRAADTSAAGWKMQRGSDQVKPDCERCLEIEAIQPQLASRDEESYVWAAQRLQRRAENPLMCELREMRGSHINPEQAQQRLAAVMRDQAEKMAARDARIAGQPLKTDASHSVAWDQLPAQAPSTLEQLRRLADQRNRDGAYYADLDMAMDKQAGVDWFKTSQASRANRQLTAEALQALETQGFIRPHLQGYNGEISMFDSQEVAEWDITDAGWAAKL